MVKVVNGLKAVHNKKSGKHDGHKPEMLSASFLRQARLPCVTIGPCRQCFDPPSLQGVCGPVDLSEAENLRGAVEQRRPRRGDRGIRDVTDPRLSLCDGAVPPSPAVGIIGWTGGLPQVPTHGRRRG